MSVRAIEAEVSIKSGVQAECSIGREVIVEVHDDVNLESLSVTENGSYRPESGVDGWNRVTVAVPERQPITEPLSVTANGQYTPANGVDGFSDVSVQVPERIPDIEPLTVTENGTYTASGDGFNPVTVNVPSSGITPSGSQTFTENGTYDVTSLAQAVVNVQASGIHTEEGYVELTDVNVGNSPALTIPVDLTSAQGFVLDLYAVETGEVSDGVVTKYDHIEVPTETGTSAMWIFNYMMKYPLNPVPEVYRNATNLATINQTYNVTYAYTRRDWNGALIGLVSLPTIASNGISVQTGNGTRFFCVAGAYVKFKYEIKWW